MHGPKQWNGECKGGWAKRVCLKCRPDSAPHGYRFCTRCEKLKTVDAFSKHFLKSNNVGGMFQRVCKSCPARTEKQHAASKLLARSHFFPNDHRAGFRKQKKTAGWKSSIRGRSGVENFVLLLLLLYPAARMRFLLHKESSTSKSAW